MSIISNRDTRFLNRFYTTISEKEDTKLKRSTTFHPHTDGQTEVVNKTLVQLLRGCNQKNLNNWDENVIYIQHSYNRVVHTSICKSPFETCFGCLSPSPLDITHGQQRGATKYTMSEAVKVEKPF